MAGIEIHRHICEIELLDGIVGAFEIGGFGVGAFRNTQVRNQISERVGFWWEISQRARENMVD